MVIKKLTVFYVIILSIGAFLLAYGVARAHSASSLTNIGIHEDAWWNWDFTEQTVDAAKVDWPNNMVYWNNADVNKVKNIFWGTCTLCSTMYFRLTDDGTNWEWVWDSGTKPVNGCSSGQDLHMRVYADSDGRLYNLSYGFYVLATTHYDRAECTCGVGWSGESENAEGDFANLLRNAGYQVDEDSVWYYNQENRRQVSHVCTPHIVYNDGYTTFAKIP